jgi:hypothetical protein
VFSYFSQTIAVFDQAVSGVMSIDGRFMVKTEPAPMVHKLVTLNIFPRVYFSKVIFCVDLGRFQFNNLNNKANESRVQGNTCEAGQTLRFAICALQCIACLFSEIGIIEMFYILLIVIRQTHRGHIM